jgi:hypothetical protein
MKHIYTYLILLNLLTVNVAFSQGANCASSAAFCAGGSTLTFPNSTGTTTEQDVDYECLASQPNPAWFFMQIGTAGNINFIPVWIHLYYVYLNFKFKYNLNINKSFLNDCAIIILYFYTRGLHSIRS